MITSKFSRPKGTRRRAAFSLVLSLTVMAMLLLLCIGAAALLAIELRVSRASTSYAKARLNALAGARIALGEIQRTLGPDQRITANAAILGVPGDADSGVARPRLVGVWKSAVIDRDYKSGHDAKFVSWLSSGAAKGEAGDGFSPARLDDAKRPVLSATGREWMLFDGGPAPYAGDDKLNTDKAALGVYAPTEVMDAQSGARFAWVAFDENQKASLLLREPDEAAAAGESGLTAAGVAALRGEAHARFFPGSATDRLDRWPHQVSADTSKVPGFASLALEKGADGSEWFPEAARNPRALIHDFSTVSFSLLTDVVNGGLKRDLSCLSAMSDADWRNDPLAKNLLGRDDSRAAWASSGAPADLSRLMVDPLDKVWPGYGDIRDYGRLSDVTAGILKKGGAAPYVEMIPYADYKVFLGQTNGANSRLTSMAPNWRLPVLARFRIEYSLVAELKTPATGATPPVAATYDIKPKLNVVAQLWNPYNVRLKLSQTQDYYWFRVVAFPVRLDLYQNTKDAAGWLPRWAFSTGKLDLGMPLFDAADMEPGEVRTFSLPPDPSNTGNLSNVRMVPGYSQSGGIILNDSRTVTDGRPLFYAMSPNDSVDTTGITQSKGEVQLARGPTLNLNGASGGNNFIGSVGSFDNTMPRLPTTASDAVNGPAPKKPYQSVGQLNEYVISDAAPSASALAVTPKKVMVSELRLKSEAFAVCQGAFSEPVSIQQSQATGPNTDDATVNSLPVEFVAWDVARRSNPADPNELQFIPSGGRTLGFIGTGFETTTGSTHYIRNRLPLTPPLNLFSLRHARLGGGSRSFGSAAGGNVIVDQYHTRPTSIPDAFGNSTPAPFVPPASLVSTANLPKVSGYFQNLPAVDYSWALNAILADTWFASSLGDWKNCATADTMGFTNDFPTMVRKIFTRLIGVPNARLSPAVTLPEATAVLGSSVVAKDAFRQAAALFVCEGGFNINSTSVRAWRAFLASGARTARIALNGTGDALPVTPAPTTGISRVNTAAVANGDAVAAAESPATAVAEPSGQDTKGWKRVNGGRELTEDQLDKLAIAMVKEVKLRGPFLSMGEFLNRRLEPGELGRHGAVQAAIENALLNEHLKTTGRALTDARLGLPNGEFGAALAQTGASLPGRISQADLLAPLSSALTPRGDTFIVRVTAEAGDGTSARASCELTLTRRYQFIDTTDAVHVESGDLTRTANKAFGRRFVVLAARWLDGSETR